LKKLYQKFNILFSLFLLITSIYDNGTISFSYQNNILKILDDGIGIKNPERVFERNYTEHTLGSGIGLDIVKRLCDMMNGYGYAKRNLPCIEYGFSFYSRYA